MAEATTFVHQIFIADGFRSSDVLPAAFQETTGSVQALYPDAEYRLWDHRSLQDFISENLGPDVRQAFDLLGPYAYKADLARYCLLFHFGGLYVDLGNKMRKRLDPPSGTGVASFRDVEFGSPCWTAVNNGVLWAKAARPEMRLAIDMIVENCRTRYYGTTWLYPTGPVLLGRAMIAVKAGKGQSATCDDQWIGASRPVKTESGVPTLCFITPDRTAVALRIKTQGADLTHLGAVGTNNYAAIWQSRTVYGEVDKRWTFHHPQIEAGEIAQRTSTGIAVEGPAYGLSAWVAFGSLEPGRYTFSVAFGRETSLPRFMQEVVCEAGETAASHVHEREELQRSALSMIFDVDRPMSNVEFRAHVLDSLDTEIVEFAIEPIAAAGAEAASRSR